MNADLHILYRARITTIFSLNKNPKCYELKRIFTYIYKVYECTVFYLISFLLMIRFS